MAVGSGRALRSRPGAPIAPETATLSAPDLKSVLPTSQQSLLASGIKSIPIGSKLPAISASDLELLRQKQVKLRATAKVAKSLSSPIQNALLSTLILAQYEAGTAVCIDPAGWILTCAHCIGDDEAEIHANMPDRRWLLTYTGIAVLAECRAWDVRRDLALLKVIAVETDGGAANAMASLCHVNLAGIKRMSRTDVVCVGQPGCDDLESTTARKTMYNLFEISYGQLRGLIPRVDPQENAEIGALKHDAWTYWGHSGAPLLREDDGTLVGLHSSWDSKTAMRHAVPLVAIEGFLKERLPAAKGTAGAS